MSNSKLMIFSCIFMLVLASSAFAADGVYISGNAGAQILNDSDLTSSAVPGVTVEAEYDTGYVLTAALGFNFGNFDAGNVRVEVEGSYRESEIDTLSSSGLSVPASAEVSAFSIMGNVFFDIKTNSALNPYVGGGIGIAMIDVDTFSIVGVAIPGKEDDDVFAYQLGGGIGYAVNDKVTIDLGYRYFATTDPEFGLVTAEYGSHTIIAGLRLHL